MNAGMIVAGWDKKNKGKVFVVPMGGTLMDVPFAVGGSGSIYINAFVDKNWKVSHSVSLFAQTQTHTHTHNITLSLLGSRDADFVSSLSLPQANMTKDECKAFVRKAVSLAISRDGSSGGVIRTVTVDEHEQTKEFLPGDQVPVYFDEMKTAEAGAQPLEFVSV